MDRQSINQSGDYVRAKKFLGQHFLTDHNIARKIVSSLAEGTENVLEIGPGMGVLTQFMHNVQALNLKIVEIDHESVAFLERNFPDLQGKILNQDFLKLPLNEVFDKQFAIIGNFPYNISSQILFRVFEYRNHVNEVVGMFQKEVAKRIVSGPGTKDYGILSVLMQAFYTCEFLFSVSEHVFSPPPKVQSGVIRLRRNTTASLSCDEALFVKVVKAGFNQRRKTLRNALSSFSIQRNPQIDELLTLRAETLGVGEFIALTNAVGLSPELLL
jgi:16S rRNA (adenine1518-N6/adenine1519-N6)-dimethyltransferase